jgi:hypothetical protein
MEFDIWSATCWFLDAVNLTLSGVEGEAPLYSVFPPPPSGKYRCFIRLDPW